MCGGGVCGGGRDRVSLRPSPAVHDLSVENGREIGGNGGNCIHHHTTGAARLGGRTEGVLEGMLEGMLEGGGEGVSEGVSEGRAEGMLEGVSEGVLEGMLEGVLEGISEGSRGCQKGVSEGVLEGVSEDVNKVYRQGVFIRFVDRRIDKVCVCVDRACNTY